MQERAGEHQSIEYSQALSAGQSCADKANMTCTIDNKE